jgi:drug/metabolite transporter (DMT)-like permease
MQRQFLAIGFLVVVVFDTLAQVSFKLAGTVQPAISLAWFIHVIQTPWTYTAIIGYLGAFVAWMTILKQAPIGPAFAAAHLYVVTTSVISFLFFGERFTPLQIIGGLLIVCGILVLAYRKSDALGPVDNVV